MAAAGRAGGRTLSGGRRRGNRGTGTRKPWVVYAKRPFAGPAQVFKYLGRYTHRVGIANSRLQAIDERGVTFATKDGKNVTLPAEEFIGRFLQHVLPRGFVKIRHYGLHASTKLSVLQDAQADLAPLVRVGMADPALVPHLGDWQDRLEALTGIDLRHCPRCGAEMLRQPLLDARPPPRP